MKNKDINQVLNERNKTHGEYSEVAGTIQAFKAISNAKLDPSNDIYLPAYLLEGLDMIYHKLGRILNGDPTHLDHWLDIAGYATLVYNELKIDKDKLEAFIKAEEDEDK